MFHCGYSDRLLAPRLETGNNILADPFLSEIRMMSFGYAPNGWALCDGQTLPINQNLALFSLLGTTFGGNGRTNFALPDLRSRVPIHSGGNFILGSSGGSETHELTSEQMPAHSHVLQGSTLAGDSTQPSGRVLATDPGNAYAPALTAPTVPLAAATVTTVGSSQPHTNMQPFLAVSFCIALIGLFPQQT